MKKAFAAILAAVSLGGAVYAAPASKVSIALIVESTVDENTGFVKTEVSGIQKLAAD